MAEIPDMIYTKECAALDAAEKVFCWYYIFGENDSAAKGLFADLGNKLRAADRLQWDKNKSDFS